MTRILLSAVLAASLGACVGSGEVTYGGGAYVDAGTPDMVEVSPGVQVIADYDESVFYTDGFYWRYYDGGWYRSNVYTGGWTYWSAPPAAVIRIGNPGGYRHYRPTGYTVRHRPQPQRGPIVRDHRDGGYDRGYQRPPADQPPVRDHREPEYRPEPRPEPGPVVRDHREPEYRAPEPRREEPGPVVRDHREPAPAPAPAPVVRDHRGPAPAPAKPKERDHRH